MIRDPGNEEKYREMSSILKDLEKKGLEFKECGFGQTRREYVKGKDFEKYLTENLETVCARINTINNTKWDPSKKTILQDIYLQFKANNMVWKAFREEGDKKKNIRRLLPYEEYCISFKCNCGRDHDQEEREHPKSWNIEKVKEFDSSFYYILDVKRSMSMIYMYLVLIIVGILLYALMPLWPYSMKIAVWWVSYILLLIITGIYIVRTVVYLFFYIFGYDLWLWPDINNEKWGFFESFRRVISYEKRDEKWWTILIRVIIAVMSGYICYQVYFNPHLVEDAKTLVYDAWKDFYYYGEERVVSLGNSTAVRIKTPSLDDINDLI